MMEYKVLAALKLALTALRPKFGDVGSRDVEVAAQQDAIDRALTLIEDEFGMVRKTERPDDFYDICTIVNSDFAIQSLLYDMNLLPEQTMQDPTKWRMTTLIACHWAAAFGKPKTIDGDFLTDAWIDGVCAPNREKRWHGDGHQYDRDTARLIIAAALQHQRGLATSDPEGHRQAVADHQAEQAPTEVQGATTGECLMALAVVRELTGTQQADLDTTIAAVRAAVSAEKEAPAAEPVSIDMVLHCPACGLQHIDAPEEHHDRRWLYSWENPPHRSHLCHGCGHIWRPADVPTNGVEAVKTKGKADSTPPTGEVKAGHLDIVQTSFEALIDSLLPSFAQVGISLRVSQEDHAAIRSAIAGAQTGIQLLKNFRATQPPEVKPAPALSEEQALAAIRSVTDFRVTCQGPLPGMIRGGPWIKLEEACAAIQAAIAAQEKPNATAADLRRFLDGAAGDGLVCGGVDAADLYCALFGAPSPEVKS